MDLLRLHDAKIRFTLDAGTGDAVEMIFDLEEKFDIQIPYNANNPRTEFDTVGEVVRDIQQLVDKKS